ncbi:MAG: ABC transporter permease [Candidatus Bathyarchaeia archaeon]
MASEIIEGLLKAMTLILSGDPILMEITIRSLAISGLATLITSLWSVPLGILIGLGKFRGRLILRGLFNSLLGLPTVTLGLILYLLFSRSGPFGSLHLLYTPLAIVIGQAFLITPSMVSFVANALEAVDPEIKSLSLTLGASETRASLTVLSESLDGVFLAATASFNRAIAELGVALMIGGNIRGVTRVLTTFIALETGRGEIALSIAFAFVLLATVTAVNLSVNWVKRRL